MDDICSGTPGLADTQWLILICSLFVAFLTVRKKWLFLTRRFPFTFSGSSSAAQHGGHGGRSLWDQPTLGSKELGPQAEAIVTFKVLLVVTDFFQPASTPNGSRVLRKVPEVEGRSLKHAPVWDNLRSGAEMLPIHRHTFLNIRSTPTLSQAPHIQSFLWDLALCPKDICFSSIVSGFHRIFMPTCANTAPNF